MSSLLNVSIVQLIALLLLTELNGMCFPSPWVTGWMQFNVSCCQLISSHGSHGAVSSHRGHPPFPPPSCLLLSRSDDWIGFAWTNPGAWENIHSSCVGISEGLCWLPYRHSPGSLEYSSSIFFLCFVEITHFRLSWLGFLLLNIFFHCNLVEILAGIFKLGCSPSCCCIF